MLPLGRFRGLCDRVHIRAGTGGAESGTASRFSLENAVPPGRHDNGDADTSTGNPDIRVPEEIEGEDGLPAGDAKRSEDADGGAERRDAGPGDPGKRPKNEEIQETSDQGRLETQGRPEGREIRHVAAPGGAQLMPAKSPGTWKTPLEDQERTPAEASRAQEGPVAGPDPDATPQHLKEERKHSVREGIELTSFTHLL
ncbi:hypothetical protein NDU88_005171 [Pleurodeles waltl]|uniref:Uncharacterized protein n=1 Tax=Pleurodeles waltl TaxID=8319 RepID=A0AAV7PF65_PLEWA|nr:hypothetical protein NDU88_005171 [Pleurodeles waltl]